MAAEDPEVKATVDAFPIKRKALDDLSAEVGSLFARIGAFGAARMLHISAKTGNSISTCAWTAGST